MQCRCLSCGGRDGSTLPSQTQAHEFKLGNKLERPAGFRVGMYGRSSLTEQFSQLRRPGRQHCSVIGHIQASRLWLGLSHFHGIRPRPFEI
jgi:hypothetical protein